MNYRKGLISALLAPMILLGDGASSNLHAAGYAVFTQGAAALGQGNAVTAHSESPSTVFYNPALINGLDGTQVEFGTTVIFSSREFESSTPGESPSSKSNAFYPSTIYLTHKFNDTLSAGLGVFSPFGLGTEWNSDWAGRYLATKSQLQTFDINPVLSFQITPSLAIAYGVDVIFLDATLEKKVPSGAPGIDIGQKFKGDGTGVGFNIGIAYDMTRDITLGASYRSAVKVNVTGDATFSSAVIPVGQLNSRGKTDITLPQQVTAAVSYKGIDALTVEAGLRWEGWSSFDKPSIALDNGSSSVTPRDWKDSFGLNLGARYRLNDTVALLGGYVYGNSAAPDSSFDPSIPDAATHVFCVGTEVSYQRFKIALSYAYQLYEERTKNNDADASLPSPPFSKANGRYQSDAHLLAMSLGYRF